MHSTGLGRHRLDLHIMRCRGELSVGFEGKHKMSVRRRRAQAQRGTGWTYPFCDAGVS